MTMITWTFAGIALVHRLMAWALAQPVNLSRVRCPSHSHAAPKCLIWFSVPHRVYDSAKPAIVFSAALLQAPVVLTPEELEIFIANSPAGLLARPKVLPPQARTYDDWCSKGYARGGGLSQRNCRAPGNQSADSAALAR
ncbi:MAG: hypothetical protein R2709_07455 [Marmoricola sp.]